MPNEKVIEFGAGNMSLKEMLPQNSTYTPSDIVKRSKETVLCDLNNSIMFELSRYNTEIFSGVLEYVYDIDKVFEQLQPFISHIVMSYACSDICKYDRLSHGWLSDYTKDELVDIFRKNNYKVLNMEDWRGQTIFNLKKLT
ncbi:class I SAM-dependent methyltransferase [Lutibacter sp. B1]|uniref:class I SAM-dependent methyltransferase n=1 Tax=Lutibacter sp. B1 TaxID=2725996 RepID=UPI0014577684|nr:class I SAM-dependent methyltransferase [Lutibacter sp. B1]NLP58160.1 class I SAM-dependent methyltransferase [Lutibacter sp. B1]